MRTRRKNTLKTKELKSYADALQETASDYVKTANVMHSSMSGVARELRSTHNLSRKNTTSILIKAGLAMIAFPDPTISDVIGAGLVAAGLIHTKIKRSALHVEDVYKTFPQVIKELDRIKRPRF